eukprot:1813360-Prymnesium_polylepis.1
MPCATPTTEGQGCARTDSVERSPAARASAAGWARELCALCVVAMLALIGLVYIDEFRVGNTIDGMCVCLHAPNLWGRRR